MGKQTEFQGVSTKPLKPCENPGLPGEPFLTDFSIQTGDYLPRGKWRLLNKLVDRDRSYSSHPSRSRAPEKLGWGPAARQVLRPTADSRFDFDRPGSKRQSGANATSDLAAKLLHVSPKRSSQYEIRERELPSLTLLIDEVHCHGIRVHLAAPGLSKKSSAAKLAHLAGLPIIRRCRISTGLASSLSISDRSGMRCGIFMCWSRSSWLFQFS